MQAPNVDSFQTCTKTELYTRVGIISQGHGSKGRQYLALIGS